MYTSDPKDVNLFFCRTQWLQSINRMVALLCNNRLSQMVICFSWPFHWLRYECPDLLFGFFPNVFVYPHWEKEWKV